jgi:hypothetical protein
MLGGQTEGTAQRESYSVPMESRSFPLRQLFSSPRKTIPHHTKINFNPI